ncbi:2-amino-4-hydroxy-6-hydroxymethyldihydropteridine diphosphokinase [Achromobacter aloeverae]|uniref:2-amino-4-hydroxy-6-hydroxymethyldihydropteridine pyrophosphokinase n=1 Tax=Achromobacter aloeverae TaxID=1750518 RepID=A0A4Q1HIG7_9BURK|nr:2-amino-4-hydroxy-6-hydroxymethyldihydropteridine diphosphokinase [Achromobacter aloeverae]RXN86046.1 2-amino-4-hydroxy-6-hydroxymethyldihydropteridine diphosphokinase [Achromobacter aloeverae]
MAYIGLGANLGDAGATLRQALLELAASPGIAACEASPFYRTAPVDAGGPDFVNAVARLRTTLAPLALLDLLQALEHRHGRERPYRNAPRTLDLDLLLYGDRVMHDPRLTLPHPRLHERAFVLRPLLDLAPGLVLAQGPAAALLTGLGGQAIERLP